MLATVTAENVSVTVPAGTFTDCFEIVADDATKPGQQITYWSPTVQGVVKSINDESYDGIQTGELASYTLVY